MAAGNDPEWLIYERQVAAWLTELDPRATVKFRTHETGRSGVGRQLDALGEGHVLTTPVKIAVECKTERRKVDIGTIDEFAGKLEDLGTFAGLLVSRSGFTDNAIRRAAASHSQAIHLKKITFVAAQNAPADLVEVVVESINGWALSALDQYLLEGPQSKRSTREGTARIPRSEASRTAVGGHLAAPSAVQDPCPTCGRPARH